MQLNFLFFLCNVVSCDCRLCFELNFDHLSCSKDLVFFVLFESENTGLRRSGYDERGFRVAVVLLATRLSMFVLFVSSC